GAGGGLSTAEDRLQHTDFGVGPRHDAAARASAGRLGVAGDGDRAVERMAAPPGPLVRTAGRRGGARGASPAMTAILGINAFHGEAAGAVPGRCRRLPPA